MMTLDSCNTDVGGF